MASKKGRKEVGGSSRRANVVRDYDHHKFLNKFAQDEYEKLKGKAILKEREFKPSVTDGHLWRMISERGWLEFCEEPDDVAMGVVREFYANGKVEPNGFTFVRGITMDYKPETIRGLYNIPPPPAGVEDWCVRNHAELDLNAIVAALCIPGTDWKRKEGTNEPTTFSSRNMNRYARAWNAFICSNLMPSTHTHDINIDRAILLWGILTDEYIDLGYLLYSSMLRYMQSGVAYSIPHGSVVTRLCSRAGVTWSIDELIQRPMAPITRASIAQMDAWPGGRDHPRGLGFIIAEQQGDDAEQQREDPVPSPRRRRAAGGARVGGAGPSRVRQVMTGSQHRRLRRQVDAVDARANRFATDLMATLRGVCSEMGFNPDWPTYGQHQPYPVPDSPPQEDASGEE